MVAAVIVAVLSGGEYGFKSKSDEILGVERANDNWTLIEILCGIDASVRLW